MNISEILIEQFGAWTNLSLPLGRQGLTVIHGPNEAGKTTLMRFVRGMLYGFPIRGDRSPMAGSLRMTAAYGDCRMHRAANVPSGSPRGEVALVDAFGGLQHPTAAAQAMLDSALHGISETLYESVFAVGLREVQELATLNDREVAEHIYGLTLGMEGRQLLAAWTGIRDERQRLLDPASGTGALAELWAEQDRLRSSRQGSPDLAARHAELARQRDGLEVELASCRQRQAGLQSQLRGHLFLDQVVGPWSRIREFQDELHALPEIPNFPENGIERLRSLESELASVRQRRDQLHTEIRQARQTSRTLAGTAALRRHASAMQGFLVQRGWVGDLQSRIKAADERLQQCQAERDACREQLGADWNDAVIDSADVSTAAHHRLAGTARSMKLAALRRAALRRSTRQLKSAVQRQQAEFNQLLRASNADSLDDALVQSRRQLEDVRSLAALRLHEKELCERQAGLDAHLARLKTQHVLPPWVYTVLGAFGVAGVVLGCWGLAAGILSSEIAGLTYILLGLTTAGVAWGIKSQFESDARQRLTELEADSQANRAELETTRRQVHQLTAACDLSEFADMDEQELAAAASHVRRPRMPSAARSTSRSDDAPENLPTFVKALDQVRSRAQVLGQQIWKTARERIGRPPQPLESRPTTDSRPASESAPVSTDPAFELGLLHQVAGRVADLEQLRRRQQWMQKGRMRLAERQRRLKSSSRELQTARQSWQDLLRQTGFPTTLKSEQAFEQWRLLGEARDHHRRCQDAEAELAHLRSLWTSFRHRLEEIDRRLEQYPGDEQPLAVLARWEQQLASLTEGRRQRLRMRQQAKLRKSELVRCAKQIKTLEHKRNALLLQGSAGDREEFEFRARCCARREELERQIAEAQSQLSALTDDHADLAIVEDDLEALDPAENRRAIQTLERELVDLEGDLTQTAESLGAVRREMQLVEEDREPSRFRFESEQVAERVRQAAEQWLALDVAARTIDEMRTRFERTCQPRVLAMASRHLHRMTAGRFTNIWTPLDRRELQIEDGRQASFSVEQLSSGTREQLFLSVRLALLEELAQKGITLPVILDDVFVNFDETRAEAAADVLLDFARQGQQVLFFTCHKHLADIFTRKGAPRLELPAREAESEPRRLAG